MLLLQRTTLYLVLVVMTGTSFPVQAQGEHSRRAAAELQVLLGDIRKLAATPDNASASMHTKGLMQRVKGGLSSLDILLRYADQELGRDPSRYTGLVASATQLTVIRDWKELTSLLAALEPKYPMVIPEISLTEQAISNALILHTTLCAACHDNPGTGVERPAYNLYEQARIESDKEFFARMLIGVRGDRITGIDNPLSDIEIIALTTLYQQSD